MWAFLLIEDCKPWEFPSFQRLFVSSTSLRPRSGGPDARSRRAPLAVHQSPYGFSQTAPFLSKNTFFPNLKLNLEKTAQPEKKFGLSRLNPIFTDIIGIASELTQPDFSKQMAG